MLLLQRAPTHGAYILQADEVAGSNPVRGAEMPL